MDTLDYVFNPESDNVSNPIPILQQQKADFTTNAYLSKIYIDNTDNTDNDKQIIENPLINNSINKNLSMCIMGLIDDCINKPDDITWIQYTPIILQKDNRFTYLLIFIIFIVLFIALIY